jgi:hypothetical protein
MDDSQRTAPSNDDIARLAYDRYVARGRADGYDLEDWLAAEQEAGLRHAGIPASADAAAPAAGDGTAADAPRRRRRDPAAGRGQSQQGPQVAM